MVSREESVRNPRGIHSDSKCLARGRTPQPHTQPHAPPVFPGYRNQNQVTFRNATDRAIELDRLEAMNDDETVRLAALGNALRPDWPISSLRTFITKHLAHRAYGDTAVALTWIATKTKTQTPRLLLEPGIWWQAALSDGTHAPRFAPYDPATHCGTCGQPEHRCRTNQHSGHTFVTAVEATRRARRNRELLPTPDTTTEETA